MPRPVQRTGWAPTTSVGTLANSAHCPAVSTVVTVVFILRFAERYAWTTTIALATGTAAGCHLLFVYWLQAILPTGYLWDNLFY